ncbi:type II CAAX prenyl endopeptidase Rce1 family protein [Fusobacterium polymorphum]|uniref:CPBP family glutamic-type intramembrane protease n=1 Tax=Fusobacterium nucleatum subsp. polymorphum TaxID=76857 RepID=UPI002B4BB91E|nr:CPBP family glutamic-type intramembrane protease [Fusobacterium polymorphum]WRL71241.1 CPBP family glutamic-type intramembrane protease [Fusobacterium polymorphum]
MTDKFKNYVDNIQENDIKSLIISPLIVLVIAQILSIFLEMASFFITTFTSKLMYNPTDYDTLISGTSFPSLVVYTLLLLAIIFLVKQNSNIKFSEIGVNGEKGIEYFCYGSLIGAFIVMIIFYLLYFSNSILFEINKNIVYTDIFRIFLIFFIIALADQILVRNYLLTFFTKMMGIKNSVILTSTLLFLICFSVAKWFKIPDIETVIYLINIFLSYTLFSLIYYFYGNMWLLVGLSAFNNFFQTVVFGSRLDTVYAINPLIKLKIIEKYSLLNGGNYGFEAGIYYTTLYLAGILFMIYKITSEKQIEEDIWLN